MWTDERMNGLTSRYHFSWREGFYGELLLPATVNALTSSRTMPNIFAHFNQFSVSLTDFYKSPNIKFQRNPPSGSCADTCRQMGGQTKRRSLALFTTRGMCLKMGKKAKLIFKQIAEVLYFTATILLSQCWPHNRGVFRMSLQIMLWKKLTMPTF